MENGTTLLLDLPALAVQRVEREPDGTRVVHWSPMMSARRPARAVGCSRSRSRVWSAPGRGISRMGQRVCLCSGTHGDGATWNAVVPGPRSPSPEVLTCRQRCRAVVQGRAGWLLKLSPTAGPKVQPVRPGWPTTLRFGNKNQHVLRNRE